MDANVVFGFRAAGRGIGSIISGPLSEVMISGNPSERHAGGGFAYDTDYRALVIFFGCTALVGGLSWIVKKAKWI